MLCSSACGGKRNSVEEWFKAACNGDTRTVTKLLPKYSTAPIDNRSSLSHGSIFNGFSAIHYAAYNGCDSVVKLLLRTEAAAQTNSSVRISALGIINGRLHLKINKGATPLMIAVIRGHVKVALMLLEYAHKHELPHATMCGAPPRVCSKVKTTDTSLALPPKNETQKRILRTQTDGGISALMLLVALNTSDAVTLLKAKDYLLLREEVDLIGKSGENAALMISLLGRDTILEEILSLILGNDEYYDDGVTSAAMTTPPRCVGEHQNNDSSPPFQRDKNLFCLAISFMKSTMRRDEHGFSVLDSARYQLNEKKWGVSRAAKERTYLLYRNLLWRIHIFSNDSPPTNIKNPCEYWSSYEECCSRLGVISDSEFKILARDLAKNPEINHYVDDILAINRLQTFKRHFSPIIVSLEAKEEVTNEVKNEHVYDFRSESADGCSGLSVFDSNVEPSSTLNSTLVLTKTVVNEYAGEQTESTLQVSVPVVMQQSIGLAQLTPTHEPHNSDKYSSKSSNSLRLSLNINFDISPSLSSRILAN